MNKTTSFLVGIFLGTGFFNKSLFSEKTYQEPNLFINGIYLENSGITIPWNTNFDELKKYGNPHFVSISKRETHVVWDSVGILKDVRTSLIYSNYKCILCERKDESLKTIYAAINVSDIERVKEKFENYSGKEARTTTRQEYYEYYWRFDGCSIKLGYHKKKGGYLWVQKNTGENTE